MTIPIIELEALHLRDDLWAVRPKGALGTCGWLEGTAWTVQYIRAKSEKEALRKAK